jgi:hypothetical protein
MKEANGQSAVSFWKQTPPLEPIDFSAINSRGTGLSSRKGIYNYSNFAFSKNTDRNQITAEKM